LDLGAEAGALLGLPVGTPLHRVDVQEGQHVLAGQQRRVRGERDEQLAGDLVELADVAQVKARRNDPSVDGARILVNIVSIPLCRSRSRSSMLSAPQVIPATIETTFAGALTPSAAPSATCSLTRRSRPHRSASRRAGASPA
jgi:hypothetical protein